MCFKYACTRYIKQYNVYVCAVMCKFLGPLDQHSIVLLCIGSGDQ